MRLTPSRHAVSLRADAAVLPSETVAVADAAGQIAVTLLPGNYRARITTAGGLRLPTFEAEAPGAWLLVS